MHLKISNTVFFYISQHIYTFNFISFTQIQLFTYILDHHETNLYIHVRYLANIVRNMQTRYITAQGKCICELVIFILRCAAKINGVDYSMINAFFTATESSTGSVQQGNQSDSSILELDTVSEPATTVTDTAKSSQLWFWYIFDSSLWAIGFIT